MDKNTNAKYQFSLLDVLITPLNDDLTQPAIDNIIGGVGPFDYSGAASPSAVEFISKVDTGAAETVTVDVSGSVDVSAVTVDELVAAITLAAPTDLTAEKDVTTGRLKISYSGAGSPDYLQVYGECATTADIGQGRGVRIAYSNTMKNFSDSPTLKEGETFTNTDSYGVDTEVLSDGYRKGVSGAFTDTAADYYMRSIVEGGVYDETNLEYTTPTSQTRKIYFMVELYNGQYLVGTSKEANLDSVMQTIVYECSGSFTDRSKERGMTDWGYSYTGVSVRSGSTLLGDTSEKELTVEAYRALDLENVA